jgi:hypothetical protein
MLQTLSQLAGLKMAHSEQVMLTPGQSLSLKLQVLRALKNHIYFGERPKNKQLDISSNCFAN